jgi:hypothetical protein
MDEDLKLIVDGVERLLVITRRLSQENAALRERLAKPAVPQSDEPVASDPPPIPANAVVDERVGGAVDGLAGGLPGGAVGGLAEGVAVASTFAPVDAPLRPSLLEAEFSRLLWFLMGVATTGFGVWLGALLF